VFRTTFCLRAFLRYLLLVVAWSRVSLALIAASHWLWISASCGHSSCGWSSLILLHLSFYIKCADSDISIRYMQFISLRDFPSWFLNSTSLHLVIHLIFHNLGHVSCFFHHSFSALFHTISQPRISQWRRMCSRSSVIPHFEHLSLCSKSGIWLQYVPILCVLCIDFQMKVWYALLKSQCWVTFQTLVSSG
jgi:hypothetical protein